MRRDRKPRGKHDVRGRAIGCLNHMECALALQTTVLREHLFK